MPAVSLVVCLHRERELLARLLQKTDGLFDDLVVVHDGSETPAIDSAARPSELHEAPAPIDYAELLGSSIYPAGYNVPAGIPKPGSIQELVTQYGGRYFEGPRCFQQEPHWPFAWSQAKCDWILRLDADEFASDELRAWLTKFREVPEPPPAVSGYTCIWPIWNGKKAITKHWPAGRNFLFNRSRVHFFGMVEQVPIADDHYEALSFVLRHQPLRKSHGLANVLVRKQGGFWRTVIARSLLNRPEDLPGWRWGSRGWPEFWQRLRSNPIRTGFYCLLRNTASAVRGQWRAERRMMPLIAVATPLHHLLIGISLFRMKRLARVRTAQT